MRYQKGTFILLPNKQMLHGLSLGALAIYVQLCDFADDEGVCFPSRKTLADRIKMSLNSVDRFLDELETNRLIERTVRRRYDGSQSSNGYQILIEEIDLPYPPVATPLPTHSEGGLPTHGEPELYPFLTEPTSSRQAADGLRVVVENDSEKPPKTDKRTKDKMLIFNLFGDKPAPWWHSPAQRKAALTLYDTYGWGDVVRAMNFWKKYKDDPYCPDIRTPVQLVDKWEKLLSFKTRNKLK